MLYRFTILLFVPSIFPTPGFSQTNSGESQRLGVPSIAASPKGPNQVNLTWAAVSDPGYGYVVEIQSAGDSRYRSWTELQPLATAQGYTCDGTIIIRGGHCSISDPPGLHVYNPPTHGIPYWVTESTYIDPQDGSAAQFIAWGLNPNTRYSFRIRSYSGNTISTYGDYSKPVTATTSDYSVRYVSPSGNDSNNGSAPDKQHAWRTLFHAGGALLCGEVLMVMGGEYPSDRLVMSQACSPRHKAVVLANSGEKAALTSVPAGVEEAVVLNGKYIVIDGLISASSTPRASGYDVVVAGSHNALLNVEVHPPVVPMAYGGVLVHGDHNLLYRCYFHDYLSPDETQNPSGNGGFVLTLEGGGAYGNAIWSNHLTRGGHDVSLCIRGCSYNRWLNNIMDGGWGMGFEAIQQSSHNLIEGNFIKDVGQLVSAYKPSIEISAAFNTVRRNISVAAKRKGLEVSALYGGDTAAGTLIYNNVFYREGDCYFQSHNGGIAAYDNIIYANNICYKMTGFATDIYLPNKNSFIINNDILSYNASGAPQPGKPIIIWNHDAEADFQYPKPLTYADKSYSPPFIRNKGLDVPPRFVDEANFDFHLSAGSPLLGAGLAIADSRWGSSTGALDLGAFGLTISTVSPWPIDAAMESARAADYAAALKDLRSRANLPNQAAVEAALLRAAKDDAAAAAVLTRTGAPAASDLMMRMERARQGNADAALWDALAAAPDRALAMADLYLEWGLTRDALEVLGHNGPNAAPPPDHALFFYYRSYCRDRLGNAADAADDLRLAARRTLHEVPPQLGAALAVLQSAVQRNPADARAHYLLAVLHRNAGRPSEARDEADSALKLLPGSADARALLGSLPPAPPPVRKLLPAAVAGSEAAKGTAPAPTVPALTPSAPLAAPTPPVAPAAQSPRDLAAMALRIAASGDIAGAMNEFTATNFPKEKQEQAVREAYLELRLRRLLALAATKQCAAADQGITNLEAEDKQLPFTFNGFGTFTKGARFQYLLGVVEFTCVDERAARRRWEKVSKADAGMASTDYAYPYLALIELDPNIGKARARIALGFLSRQLGSAAPGYQGMLLYSQGLLQTVIGKKAEALASFHAGAEAGPPGLVEYLNLEAIRALEAGR